MKKATNIRLGIIGCGAVVEDHHLPALRRVGGIEVVALADPVPERLSRLARQLGTVRRHSGHAELLESGNVDAIAVCVPPKIHTEVTLAALRHGKHVFIEKPLALSLPECDTLAESVRGNDGLKVMVGFNLRWHRLIRQAREFISQGQLGDIKVVRTVFAAGAAKRPLAPWRKESATGGGALFDLGVHHFDALRFLLRSEATEVYSLKTPAEDISTVMMRMENGAQVTCSLLEGVGESHTIEIYGDRKWLRLSCYEADGLELFSPGQYPGSIRSRLRAVRQGLGGLPRFAYQMWQGGDYVNSYVNEWRHFASAIMQDTPVECGVTDGRRALEIALAAHASSTKRVIHVEH